MTREDTGCMLISSAQAVYLALQPVLRHAGVTFNDPRHALRTLQSIAASTCTYSACQFHQCLAPNAGKQQT